MKRIIALLVPALLAVAPAAPCATACRCVRPSPPPAEAFETAEVVFRGVVVGIEPAGRDTAGPAIGVDVRFRVLETWKGGASDAVTVNTGTTSCHRRFMAGEEYVVYAQATRSPRVARVPMMCGNRTRPTASAAKDLAMLRRLAGG